ncbi:hypothetical protein [Mucilaginibacter sp.]|uniref:hypothetical protein n=1 Tax=Mucilaginibacter sp. TaxID=1882438 RepID=UPI003AFFDAB4
MSNISLDQFYQNIESGVESLAKSTLHDYATQAKSDGQTTVDGMKEYLQQWKLEVEEGALTLEDLKYLLKEAAAVTEMAALKEAGLAAIRIDEFRLGITNVITGAVASLIKV